MAKLNSVDKLSKLNFKLAKVSPFNNSTSKLCLNISKIFHLHDVFNEKKTQHYNNLHFSKSE